MADAAGDVAANQEAAAAEDEVLIATAEVEEVDPALLVTIAPTVGVPTDFMFAEAETTTQLFEVDDNFATEAFEPPVPVAAVEVPVNESETAPTTPPVTSPVPTTPAATAPPLTTVPPSTAPIDVSFPPTSPPTTPPPITEPATAARPAMHVPSGDLENRVPAYIPRSGLSK